MLLDPETLDLAPRAQSVLDELPAGLGAKLELPASQLELAGRPAASLEELAQGLADARRRMADALDGGAIPACAGVHPFAAGEGELNRGARYERLAERYGSVARRQLVCALHVHVALDGAERALAVYNAMRAHLPDVAALAANAPIHEGRDTGMASVRPAISGMLPRQGIPPAFACWEQLAAALARLVRAGAIADLGEWWWELRLHPRFGTIEVRVADAQTEPADAAAVAAFASGLVLRLAERHDAGELEAPVSGWLIAENRSSAARHGARGEMLDLASGRPVATTERLHGLLQEISPLVVSHGGGGHLGRVRELIERGGAERRREAFASGGAEAVARELAAGFLAGTAEPGPC